jgi:WD40 repeat protein
MPTTTSSSSSSSSSDASNPTAGRAANSTAAPPEHPPPPPQTPPPPPPPLKYALARAAREGHGHPIYCVAFSRHVHASSSSSPPDDDDEVGSDDDGDDGGTVAVFATCGGPYATVYEVAAASPSSPSSPSTMKARQVYRDVDDGETFYTCAFGGRGVGSPLGYSPVGVCDGGGWDDDHDATINGIVRFGDDDDVARERRRRRRAEEGEGRGDSKRRRIGEDGDDRSPSPSSSATRFLLPHSETQDGPPLLCLGGTRGTIKVLDTVRRGLFLTLSGHGNDVTDLKFSPSDEWLLLSSSKDESVRLWNLRRGANVAIFAGHNGHRGQVLSVSWHLGGAKFATSGMDNMVKLWKVYDGGGDGDEGDGGEGRGPVETALRKSEAIVPDDWSENGRSTNKFDTLFHQFPYFSTNRAHTDYVGERVHS